MLNYAHQFIKIRLVFRLISKTKTVTPIVCFISERSKSLSVRSRSFKKNLSSKKISRERP